MGSNAAKRLSSTGAQPEDSSFLRKIGDILTSQGADAYLVGGFLRDHLLGRDTSDLDIAVSADPLLLGQRLAQALGGTLVPLDQPRGLIRVVARDRGRSWVVDLSPCGQDILADLARRDFTVDAMALPLLPLSQWAGQRDLQALLDPFNGRGDLERRLIRAVGPAVFQDDPARLLRALRLKAQLGFSIEASTRGLIREKAPLIQSVAQERIRDEFLKLITSPNANTHLRILDDLGLLCRVIPELAKTKGVAQPKEHHWDVFGHSIETVGVLELILRQKGAHQDPRMALVPWDDALETYFSQEASDSHPRLTMLKLAGLLHDVSKPATKTFDPTGRMRFFGHHTQGAAVAENILKRLRVSARGVAMVREMVRHHLRPSQMGQNDALPTDRAVYRYYRDVDDVAIDTLYLNLADFLAARGPTLDLQDWACHCRIIGHILRRGLEQKTSPSQPKLIDGHDIMSAFGLAPGPAVGALLEIAREAVATGAVSTKQEAIALLQRHIRGEKQGA